MSLFETMPLVKVAVVLAIASISFVGGIYLAIPAPGSEVKGSEAKNSEPQTAAAKGAAAKGAAAKGAAAKDAAAKGADEKDADAKGADAKDAHPRGQVKAGEKEIDPMDVMLGIEESRFQSHDDTTCERVARTKEFDKWVKDFTSGDLKTAEKDWGDVLRILRKTGVGDCSHLHGIANARTLMLDSKTSVHLIWQHLYDATQHSFGDHDRFTAVCLKFLAMQAEGARDFTHAADYRKRQLAILQEVLGKNHSDVITTKHFYDRDVAALAAQKH